MPEHVLEELWAFGLERFGSNGIQTNGSLINDRHIALFKQYTVYVGISVDGPGRSQRRSLGRHRSTLTREATAKTHAAIERLVREGLTPSLIVTLHRNNATADKLPRMRDWFRYLDTLGITSVRLHDLEIESAAVGAKYGLTPRRADAAFLEFAALEPELRRVAIRRLLRHSQDAARSGRGAPPACGMRCDPYTTRAVQGVEGHGQRSNCGRTNKDGIDFVKADREGFERYLALYHAPQSAGGCQDCRFFLMCKGQCPGGAIDGDWRNRSSKCESVDGAVRAFRGGARRRRPGAALAERRTGRRWKRSRSGSGRRGGTPTSTRSWRG